MEIRLVKTRDDINKLTVKGSFILEQSITDGDEGNLFNYKLYDCCHNSLEEICPEIPKIISVAVYEAAKFPDYVHFVTSEDISDTTVRIDIVRYVIAEKRVEVILSLEEDKSDLRDFRKIKIFVLSPSHVLLQYEDLSKNHTDDMMGHIIFSQRLYNSENGEITEIKVEDFINNGINKIIPISDSKIMIKTGYSYIDDTRYSAKAEAEAVIESIYVVNLARFISDLLLQTAFVDMQLVYSVYFDKYILNPKCSGEYILFDVIDPEKNDSQSVFFNYSTGKTISYKNISTAAGTSEIKLVLGNVPYMLRRVGIRSEFLNLETQEFDIMFEGEDYADVIDKVLITLYSRNGKNYILNVYGLPGLDFLTDVKGVYVNSCTCGRVYYIYYKNNNKSGLH